MNRKKSKIPFHYLQQNTPLHYLKTRVNVKALPTGRAQFNEVRKMMIMKRVYSLLVIFAKS